MLDPWVNGTHSTVTQSKGRWLTGDSSASAIAPVVASSPTGSTCLAASIVVSDVT
jgi:hypothetical protein